MNLAAINVHPVKSAAIRPLQESYVERGGLRSDREWMVVDAAGSMVSARELPTLFGVRADTPSTDPTVPAGLRLQAEGFEPLQLDLPDTEPVRVSLFDKVLTGRLMGGAADAWLDAVTGSSGLHLIWCSDPSARQLNPQWAAPADYTAYADSSPLTLASTSSLAQLNQWIAEGALERGEEQPEPLPIERFRPNLVIDDIPEPFAEDGWSTVRIGDVPFRVVAPVDRCVITTIDPPTQERGREPIRTLARHRRWDGKTWFAVKLVPEGEGPLRVGDPVEAG